MGHLFAGALAQRVGPPIVAGLGQHWVNNRAFVYVIIGIGVSLPHLFRVDRHSCSRNKPYNLLLFLHFFSQKTRIHGSFQMIIIVGS